ncbi:MAG TPA: ATP-binding protein [Gaiellaceae bacterium]|nr:ATP-binding protein [Gaiellaceae bacterium]
MHSARRADGRQELLRRFVEAARRAQIVTIVNLAQSEGDLGELFTAELCEAFEAEVAFVIAEGNGGKARTLVGAYGLTPDQRADLLEDGLSARALTSEGPQQYQGDLLGIGIRELVLAPFAGEAARGVVGVGRLYDEPFDDGEVALLEAVVESLKHALERIRLSEERDVLLARERAARREAESTAERLVRLQSITTGTILSELPLESMLRELLERIREIVAVDTAAILLVEEPDAELALRAAVGADAHIEGAVELARREGVARRVLDERREVDLGDAHIDGNRRDDEAIRSLIGVPMTVERRVVGVLVAGAVVPRDFSREDVSLLGLAADRAAIAIENARLYREAEERGQAARVLGYVADGVFLVDAQGTVQLWNPAAEAITGIAADEVLGRPVDEVIPGWDALAQAITVTSAPAASTGPSTTLPVEIGGRELWLSVAGVSFAEGTVYAFRDRTEERRLEELKEDFIATVSHELRTPIAAVYGAVQTLEREDVDFTSDLRRRLLSVISDQSERLAYVVNDILLTSQVESGQLVLVRERVNVLDIARRVIEAARTQAPRELSLELKAPPALPPLATDTDKFRQVLANLVSNAVKYSRGAGRIEVQLEPRRPRLRIAVRDEGVGIPGPEQKRIFEKFYRLPDRDRAVGGTGLGLYICRELVRRMDGRIWVESSEGIGSTFFVELPGLGSNQ